MSERELWQEVLLRAVADARLDPSSWPVPESAYDETTTARRYLTTPSKDLATVCSLAGVEVDALLERMQKRVAGVPVIQPVKPEPEPKPVKVKPERVKPVKDKKTRARGIILNHDGWSLPIKRWSQITGISANAIADRLRRGWTVADALTVPTSEGIRHGMKKLAPTITYEGETLTYREWAERTGLSWFTIRERVRKGWPVEEVLRPGDLRGALIRIY